MRLRYRALVFRMKLHSYEPGMALEFHDLHEVVFLIYTHGNKPGADVLVEIQIVKFIPVPVPF